MARREHRWRAVSTVLALVLAGVAGLLLPRPAAGPLGRLRDGGRAGALGGAAPARARRAPGPGWLVAALAGGTALVLSGTPVLALTSAVAAGTAVSVVGRRTARRQADRAHRLARDLLAGLAAELRSGASPRTALTSVAAELPEVTAAARSPGRDVATVLRQHAGRAGLEPLGDLAAAWVVVERSGAPLAPAVARLAAAARADEAVRQELAAALAGPRASAVLLSLLPGFGVLLGSALGADPVDVLVGTGPGRLALLGGTLLVAAGVRWTEAIVESAGQA